MPKVGQIVAGAEAGKRDKYKYVWLKCEECGEVERWVRLRDYEKPGFKNRCVLCYREESKGEKSPSWEGGKYIDGDGYVRVLVHGHPLAHKRGYVLEHRLVAAEIYGLEAVRKKACSSY